MKKLSSLLLIFALFSGHNLLAESQISLQPEVQGLLPAGAIQYSFTLLNTRLQKSIGENDLKDSHTKKLHFIAYDAALKEFNHVHPKFDGRNWTAELNLPANGNYVLWAQGTLVDGTEFSVSATAQLENGLVENPVLPLPDSRSGIDNQTVFQLSNAKVKAGKSAMLTFKVSRSDGQVPVMAPYLGALAHVIAAPAAGGDLIHVHPMAGNEPNTGMIHATFPKEGTYRLWVQFIERDELVTIPLSIPVVK